MATGAGAGGSPPELDSLTADQLRTFREAFSTIDQAGDGYIVRSDVGTAMRAVGLHPAESELAKLVPEVVPTGKVDFVSFCVIVARHMGVIRNVPAMVRAFQVFDPLGTGYVNIAVFRDIFEKIGEIPTEPSTVDEMIAFADPEETGQVYYEPFVTHIFVEFEAAKKAKELAAAKK